MANTTLVHSQAQHASYRAQNKALGLAPPHNVLTMVNSFQTSTFVVGTMIAVTLPTIWAGHPEIQHWKHRRPQHVRSLQIVESAEEVMDVQKAPLEIDVDPRSTYNEKFMALMNSPCRPESDGYFGATSGKPTRIQYGFRLEVQPLSKIMDLLDVVEDRIVDSVLMNSFPLMCGLEGRRLAEDVLDVPSRGLEHVEGHPTGFRFLKFEEVEKCTPTVNEVNFCGVFTGVVYVYGKHQGGDEAARTVRSYIDKVLKTDKIAEIDPQLAAIDSVEEYSSIDVDGSGSDSSSSSNDDDGLSRLGILLIVIGVLLALAIIYYFYIQWSERKLGGTIFSNRQNSKRRQWNRIVKRYQRNQYKDYDPEERSIRSSGEAEDEFEDDYDDYESNIGQHINDPRLDLTSAGGRSFMSGSDRSGRVSGRASGMTLDQNLDGLQMDPYGDDDDYMKSRSGGTFGDFII